MKGIRIAVVVVAGVLLLATTGQAHHSVPTFYLADQTVEITGVVKTFRLINPHMRMEVEVTDADGETAVWYLEGGNAGALRARGWTPTSLEPGEVVTVTGNPARNPEVKGLNVHRILKEDGTALGEVD